MSGIFPLPCPALLGTDAVALKTEKFRARAYFRCLVEMKATLGRPSVAVANFAMAHVV